MGPEDLSSPNESRNDEVSVATQLRLLTERVAALEQELAELRSNAPRAAAVRDEKIAPPPPPVPARSSLQMQETAERSSTSGSLENRLGAQVFNRIGIIALMIGVTWFLKLAVDNQWIGPVGRILAGFVAGAGVMVWSEQFRRKGFAVFSYSLKAIGTGVLYLSLWAAQQLYHLLPPAAALFGMVLVAAWNAYMAWAQNAELLAAYALAGGLATPLLLSTGSSHEVFLFTYLLAIDAATVVLVRFRPWHRLLLAAFSATVLYFIFWYARFYSEPAFAVTTVFVALFFSVFVVVPFAPHLSDDLSSQGKSSFSRSIPSILLPLGDAAFVSLALYSVMQDSERHWFLPWLMLILSAAYMVIARLPQQEVPAAIHLSLAVVFLTIAIPLKANGHWITAAWLAEGVALLWVATRISSSRAASHAFQSHPGEPGRVLRWLSAGSLALGFLRIVVMPFWFDGAIDLPFFNHNLAAAIAAVAAFAIFSWLAWRAEKIDLSWRSSRFAPVGAFAVQLVAVLISLREVVVARSSLRFYASCANADFGMALLALGILSAVAWVSWRIALSDHASLLWLQLSGGSVIAINLIAILTGVREINSLWPSTLASAGAEFQRGLAVSAFLMAYGAILLAAGFWKRSAFIRWQALILLVLTIGKTFLYDMRNLSQGYRVVSFLGLGILLMAVSFAYQKDWLSLREQGKRHPSETAGSSR